MRKSIVGTTLVFLCGVATTNAGTHEKKDALPAGPIRDRHELMERIGKNAKSIGEAAKSGNLEAVPAAAAAIEKDAAKTVALFPEGSLHPASRAKAEIWTDWAAFEAQAKDLQTAAAALASAAASGGDVAAAAKVMFKACKNCHDQFRTPEE
jgi:cytochrome c556